MTEAEWLESKHPATMLESLYGTMTNRKKLLFAIACANTASELMFDQRSKEAVEVAEQIVEGDADRAKAEVCWLAAHSAVLEAEDKDAPRAALGVGIVAWRNWSELQALAAPDGSFRHDGSAENGEEVVDSVWAISFDAASAWCSHTSQRFHRHSHLLRDIFGNPYRPVAVEPPWLTSDVRIIAEGIYQDRAFDRLPILADALQDAGCHNTDILAHCRQPGEHVRGCWVVDLVLGKS